MRYKKNNFVNNEKRSKNGLLWEFFKRWNKLNKIKNNRTQFNNVLMEVMTFKECEIVYKLPAKTCERDLKNNKININHVRKSGNTYILTNKEAKRLYENYWTDRAYTNDSHLYSGFDGKKMTETEFLIKYGGQYKKYIDFDSED